jgi:hypothetical protein
MIEAAHIVESEIWSTPIDRGDKKGQFFSRANLSHIVICFIGCFQTECSASGYNRND